MFEKCFYVSVDCGVLKIGIIDNDFVIVINCRLVSIICKLLIEYVVGFLGFILCVGYCLYGGVVL